MGSFGPDIKVQKFKFGSKFWARNCKCKFPRDLDESLIEQLYSDAKKWWCSSGSTSGGRSN